MGGRDRNTGHGRQAQGNATAKRGIGTANRGQLGDLRPHGLDDTPAAQVGTPGDGEIAGIHHPHG